MVQRYCALVVAFGAKYGGNSMLGVNCAFHLALRKVRSPGRSPANLQQISVTADVITGDVVTNAMVLTL
jgi:hypothetical protein